ncbi:hypothetical protein JR316_0007333 [Psilocybe cubensis]|uniref:Uncharacterized protein n=1 Tax=Psilocybe cubensis TaxID=181762 RepID=A0ACB8GYY5_PSICU|nr:hypothetical protein JR316_0007333 [Psilocybe cubensis]KAH9480733.1 hypothetical protein JR316_0007333 [Psilocybe cubensis]
MSAIPSSPSHTLEAHVQMQDEAEGGKSLKTPDSSSFFQDSRNVSINGGHFNSTMGHHTNVTIHLAQAPFSNTDSPSTTESKTRTQTAMGTTTADAKPKARRTDAPNNQPRQRIPAMHKSNEIYERQLSLKGRGLPLWIPEPNRRLPINYRKDGVSIGDVGIITPSGGFSFLFNICLPADDPINLGRVPEDFVPIYPQLDDSMDIREFFEFKQGSYLASTSIENSQTNSFFPELLFESMASEGAILTMPEGAISFDLENIPRFRAYAAANVESWYRFVNGPRGREAKNGDIRLVTGCDKTTSWGMAVLSNISQERKNCLRFKAAGDPQRPSTCTYSWECSGMVEARIGPDRREIDDLRRRDRNCDFADNDHEKYMNQCLFVRTLNLALGAELWEKVNQELALAVGAIQDQNARCSKCSKTTPGHSSGNQSSFSQKSAFSYSNIVDKQLQISMSTTPEITTFHPSRYVNDLLLESFPEAKMVISHDSHWMSVVNEDCTFSTPQVLDLLNTILDKYDIIDDENGVIYLNDENEGVLQSSVMDSPIEDILSFRGMAELSLDWTDVDGYEGTEYDLSADMYTVNEEYYPPPLYSDIPSGWVYTSTPASDSDDADNTRPNSTAGQLPVLIPQNSPLRNSLSIKGPLSDSTRFTKISSTDISRRPQTHAHSYAQISRLFVFERLMPESDLWAYLAHKKPGRDNLLDSKTNYPRRDHRKRAFISFNNQENGLSTPVKNEGLQWETDRIDLAKFHPFIAAIAHVFQIYPDYGVHRAILSKILGVELMKTKTITNTRVVILGEATSLRDFGTERWWPEGNFDERQNLKRRILNDGRLLPIPYAWFLRIYTTTAIPISETPDAQFTGRRRARLCLDKSPIADFGIEKVSFISAKGEGLAYYYVEDDQCLINATPENHYRFYFTTLSGNEYYIDVGLAALNFGIFVDVKPYSKLVMPHLGIAPCFFEGRDTKFLDSIMFKSHRHWSALRDPRVHRIAQSVDTSAEYFKTNHSVDLCAIMDEISGGRCKDWEKDLLLRKYLPDATDMFRLNMEEREYMRFPATPPFNIKIAHDTTLPKISVKHASKIVDYVAKMERKLKKGQITREKLESLFR